jgi:hypothetical protein
MKKFLLIVAVLFAVNTLQAQGGGQMDPAQMLERMKQMVKPSLMEKTKLSDAQADKVLEVNIWAQQQRRGFRELGEEERAKKQKEIQEEVAKKYKAIPLTDDQIKAVEEFYAEMRRNMQNRGGGGGGK